MLVTLTLGSLLRTLPPTLSKIAIDDGVLADNLGVLFVTIGLFVGAVVLSNVAMAGRLYAARYSAQKVIHDIRNDLYTHLSAKSMSFFDRHQTGDLMSRVTNDVNMIQFFFTMAGTVILSSIALTAMNLIFMFALDWVMALAIIALVPFFVAMQSVAKRVVPLFRQSNQQMGVVNVEIREAISGIKVIQAFGREQYQEERFDRENWKLRDLRTRVLRTFALYSQGIELIAGGATALILGLGAWRIVNGEFTLGGLVAFQGYLLLMLAPTPFPRIRRPDHTAGRHVRRARVPDHRHAAGRAGEARRPSAARRGVARSNSTGSPSNTATATPSCATFPSMCRPADRSPSSAAAAPARAPWPTCCLASTTRPRAPSG